MSDVGPRSLLPREHGAYAELGIPLLTAVAVGRFTVEMALLAAAAVAGFFAYEPLLVLLGYRGSRARAAEEHRARRRLALLAGLAVGFAIAAVVLAPPAARWALAVPAPALLGMIALGLKRRLTGRAGEIVAAVALSSVSVPVAVFGAAPPATAVVLGIVWVAGFGSYNLAVRAILDQGRRDGAWLARRPAMAFIAGLSTAVAVAAGAGWLPWIALVALAPLSAASLLALIVFPRPQRVAVLGWSAVAGSVVTAALLVAMLSAGVS